MPVQVTSPTSDIPHLTGGPKSVTGRYGLVTSVEERATRAGIAILESGGNAVDAAIATAFTLAVTHPSAGNIGGGGFMLVRTSQGSTLVIDFRETAPRALTQPAFRRMLARGARGPAAVGIPGTVAGLWLAHQKFGKTPWKDLLASAIRLAQTGYSVGRREALTLRWSWPLLKQDPESRKAFGDSAGNAPKPGTYAKKSALARTLHRIADEGRAGFYAGPVAKALTRLGPGGLITEDDLARYEAKLRTPLAMNYRGWRVETMPPPSGGGVALVLLLRFLEREQSERFAAFSVESLHLFSEASRRAQAERRFTVADPDRFPVADGDAARSRWTSGPLPFEDHPIRSNGITASKDLHPLYAQAMQELEHTTHLSVSDANGMVVSLTTTLSAGFGAKISAPGTGMVLNNSVAAFGTVGANTLAPGFRTTSSMAPTLVTHPNGTQLVLGSPGGDTIPSTVAQILTHLVDHNHTLGQAVTATRVHHGFVPDEFFFERNQPLAAEVVAGLQKLGHKLKPRGTFGDANNLLLVNGVGFAVADGREGGLALAARQPH